MDETVHLAHSIDGYPLCEVMDKDEDEDFLASYDESEVTCSDCIRYLKEK